MPVHLPAVWDHPAVLLDGLKPEASAPEHLRQHERLHDVTFAALDNSALAAVREDFDTVRSTISSLDLPEPLRNLVASIGDLLGLAD